VKSVVIFLLFCFSGLFAQSKIAILGNVKSDENINLIGARIVLTEYDSNFYFATDTLGTFSANLKLGLIKVTVNHNGYLEKQFDFYLKKDTLLSVVLEKKISILDEVVVFNKKKNAVTFLSGGKLSLNLKESISIPTILGTTDIIKLLQLTPGVQNSGDANGYLYVRGGDPGHNSIVYAGTPIYGMSHLAGVFPFYNADHIGEVEFDKSSSNAKFGGRLSSTISLIPNKKLPKEFSVQGNVGLLASQVTFSVPLSSHSGLYVSGRKTYIDEIVSSILDSKKRNVASEEPQLKYRFSDCNLTFISEVAEKHLFTANVFISGDKLGINDPKSNLNANLKWGNMAISSDWTYKISENKSIKNALYFSHYANELDLLQGAVKMNISSYIQDVGYKNSMQYSIKKIPFETGLECIMYNMQPQKISVSNIGIEDIDKKPIAIKANAISIYTNAKPKLLPNLFAEFGLRLNYYSSGVKSNSFFNFEPRIMFNYLPEKDFSFFASYTRQNQYLNLITTSSVGIPSDFWIGSSDGIPSQSSNEFSIGYNQNITKNSNSSLSSYYRKMKNLIEYPYGVTQFNQITTFKNDMLVGDGESYGIEWMLKKDSGKFKGWLSYTLSWSNRQFDELNNGNLYYAKYDRRHNLSFVGTFDFNKKWSFGLTQIFSSGNRFTMPTSWYFINNTPVKEYNEFNNAQLPNYIRTDVSVNYFFIKTLKEESTLNLSIYNTFNIENPIYVLINVFSDKDTNNNLTVNTDKKILYRILPSLSWRFKF
jgi:hypothetical protein